jgi:hypothetical protein
MGIIVPRSAMRVHERQKIEIRLKLFDELRNRYIADGIPTDKANARALAKVRNTTF